MKEGEGVKTEKCERICAYCEKAVPVFDKDSVLCEKNGIVSKAYSCKRFSYDPLKRVPPKIQAAPTLEFIDIDD